MPNWTKNELEVSGKAKEVRRFLKHMGEGFSFERIIPMPENCFRGNLGTKDKEECLKKGIPNWYDWCSENWGTKWDCSEVEVEKVGCLETNAEELDAVLDTSKNYSWVIYKFQTAWDAPHPIIAKLKSDWPDLDFGGGYVHEGYEGCGSF